MWNMKWIVPAAALGLLIGVASIVPAHADDSPTTMPSTAPSATITVTVVDASNNPVSGATVMLFPKEKHSKAEAGAADATNGGTTAAPAEANGKKNRPAPLAKAETDDKGVAVLNVADLGSYRVVAMMKGVGRGNATVSIDTDGQAATASITLKPKAPKQ